MLHPLTCRFLSSKEPLLNKKGREKAKGTGTCIRCNNQTGIGVTFLFLFRRPFFPGSSSPPSLSSSLSASGLQALGPLWSFCPSRKFRCQEAVLEFAVCPIYSGPGLVPLLICRVHLLLDSVPVGLEVYHGDGIHMVVGEVPYVPAGISSIHQNIQEPDLLPRVFDNKKMEKMIV